LPSGAKAGNDCSKDRTWCAGIGDIMPDIGMRQVEAAGSADTKYPPSVTVSDTMRMDGSAIQRIRAPLPSSTGRKSIIAPVISTEMPSGSSSISVVRQSCASSLSRITASVARTPAPTIAQSSAAPVCISRCRYQA
jgi:hypothetical protein